MAIFRGDGGAGDSNTDATISAVTAQANIATTKASDAAASAVEAANSATTAATKATQAATSATDAANSATGVAAYATAAQNSATAAATSETNAATSATGAATSATAASASETASGASETASAASATTATTKASEAATSATSASTSASTATTKASEAATSASNAATSETNAATSASTATTKASEASTSASNAATSATNAAASYDDFDDRYLGAKSSAPSTDNDGDALVTGALYFDTSSNAMKVYSGSAWLDAYASLSGALIATNNLSDLNNVGTARTNLGLGTAATTASTDYATAAQGTKVDGIEANADVTDTANVTAAGALMDSELTSEASVKALNQGVATTDSPTFAGLTVDTNTLYVDSTNNRVGVGTTSPDQALTVSGNIQIQDNDGYLQFKDTNGGTDNKFRRIYNSAQTLYISRRNDDESLEANDVVIDSSGNVGIGTTSPTSNLEVSDSTQATGPTLSITNSHEGSWASGDKIGSIDFRIDDASATEKVRAKVHLESKTTGTFPSNSDLVFSTTSANTLSEAMRIDASGNVGIGTTSPSEQLDVVGDIGFSGRFLPTSASSATSASAPKICVGYDYDTGFFQDTTNTIGFATAGSARMRIDSSGNVGIGTTSADEALEVSGDVKSSGGNFGIYHFGDTSDVTKIVGRDASHGSFPNTMDFFTNSTQRMRIQSNGVVLFAGGISENAETLSGTSTTIDLSSATNFTHNLVGNTTYTFSNPAASGSVSAFTLKIRQDTSARTITWPSSVDWAGGTAPTLTSQTYGIDIFTFFTLDGGTTYYGFVAGQAMS